MAKNNQQISDAVHCGEKWQLETVDFGDVDRPKTCLEVDFPILPINSVAAIEGNAGKPIYQMSKWWARRRSSVFRAMLLAAATKAPDDPADAAKTVWDAYYGNHQDNAAFRDLKVADIFMGGGTTLVEGNRLGFQMFGNDLNPVAWFIVKNEMANVDKKEVEALLKEIEEKVKPVIEPFYQCKCPRKDRGHLARIGSQDDCAPAEIIYTFLAKHGPCSATGCHHRTPIMQTPVIAVKTLTVKAYPDVLCPKCEATFDIEMQDVRIAPKAIFIVADMEKRYGVRDGNHTVKCPHCLKKIPEGSGLGEISYKNLKLVNKPVGLTLLIHPDWLEGSSLDKGGCADDSAEDTAEWNRERTKNLKLIEVRGTLPEKIRIADFQSASEDTKFQSASDGAGGNNAGWKPAFREMFTDARGGTVPGKSQFKCARCGREQDILTAVKKSGKTAPVAMYAVQGYCPKCDEAGKSYGGRFFDVPDCETYNAAARLWQTKKQNELNDYYPKEEIPYGYMTGMANGDIRTGHGFTHWYKMFNVRQLLGLSLLLKAIVESRYPQNVKDYVLGAFQQYIRNQCMFSFWHLTADKLAPAISNGNFHPKANIVEVGMFAPMGYGPWISTLKIVPEVLDWVKNPWELVSLSILGKEHSDLVRGLKSKSVKVYPGDALTGIGTRASSPHSVCGLEAHIPVCVEKANGGLEARDPAFHSRGYLPHIEQKEYQFITFRLFDSMAQDTIAQWKKELKFTEHTKPNSPEAIELQKRIAKYEDAGYGNCFLKDPQIAKVVHDALFYFDGQRYQIIAWCIMPNHVHVLVKMNVGTRASSPHSLSNILHSWKSYTANEANKILNRQGQPFWMPEYFDRYIRDEEHFEDTVHYILNNPIKAGLKNWEWTGSRASSPHSMCGQDAHIPSDGLEVRISTCGQDARDPVPHITCGSSNELAQYAADSLDMVITDPPFGGLLYYAELSDFFYVWLRLALKDIYPEQFGGDYTPKALEVIANKSRHDNPDAFYQTMLTQCWRETYRILKPGGILAFTFHHSEDEPWLNVLRSLFEANFYLEATYPIRSDETKGQGEFGSKKIEFDIIHVCRKRMKEPERISWARLRRKILDDVSQITEILNKHQAAGLGEADLQVIRRGKALEHYSQHYGNVFGSDGSSYDLKQILLSVNQVLDEQRDKNTDVPPSEAEPLTRMFLRLFIDTDNMPRDQIQKYLRGTGTAPSELTARNWCSEKKKVFTILRPPEFLKHRQEKKRGIPKDDFEQAWYLIGVCTEGSGMKFQDIVKPEIFAPHPATLAVIEWFTKHGADEEIRKAARLAQQLWKVNVKEQESPQQKELF